MLAGFRKKSLDSISYTVHVDYIEELMPEFEKAYGPPRQTALFSSSADQLGTAEWHFSLGEVSLTLVIIPGEDLGNDPAIERTSRHAMAVQVSILGRPNGHTQFPTQK